MIVRICLLAWIVALNVQAEVVFEVIHKKPLWPDSRGALVISEKGIEFRKTGKDELRRWTYQAIQHLDRISPTEIVLLTYEDVAWRLGQDRQYRFVLTSGKISNELFEQISSRIQRPVTDRVVDNAPQEGPRLPVKHLHTFGGCEGELVFGDSAIFYVTGHAKDRREWKIGRDIDSVWAQNRYQLELHVYDNNRREFSRTRVYRFQLKRPLDPVRYRNLKLRLYGLRAEQSVIP